MLWTATHATAACSRAGVARRTYFAVNYLAPPQLDMMCNSWTRRMNRQARCAYHAHRRGRLSEESPAFQAEDSIFQTPNVLRIFWVNSNFDIASSNFSTSPSFIR